MPARPMPVSRPTSIATWASRSAAAEQDGARIAFPLLKRAVRARPDDVFAWEALGLAAGQLGRDDESLAAFGKALAREPTRESTLVGAAYQCMKMGRRQDAVGLLAARHRHEPLAFGLPRRAGPRLL